MTRELHPGAWWLWALGLATAASRTTNPFLLVTVLLVVFVVTRACRPDRSSAGGFRGYLILAAVVIGIRVVFRVVLGGGTGTHELFRLPEIPLPASSGIRAGGAVTAEAVVGAVYDGLRLATLLVCFGAANVLANPKRLIKAAPAALHEVGVAVTVAVSVAPQLVDSARRVRRARRLRRGSAAGRMHLVRQVLLPVMTDALDRSLMLAAAMDARGHGRVAGIPARTRRLSSAALLVGLCGVCVGTYALLDGTVSRWLGVPAMVVGVALSACGVVIGNRRIASTVYRPDPWARREWLVAACGVAVAFGLVASARLTAGDLNPSAGLLEWPVLPVAAFVIVLLGALPVVIVE
jgi:energy-coupling factor transport system permease protein